MLNQEPPIFDQNSGVVQEEPAVRSEPKRSKVLLSGMFMLLLTSITLAGLVAGFVRGEAFARKNAQYDNPQLRDYYSAKCYEFWEKKFKVTVASSLEKMSHLNQSHTQKLDLIYQDIKALDQQVTQLALMPSPAALEPKLEPKAILSLKHKAGHPPPVRKKF